MTTIYHELHISDLEDVQIPPYFDYHLQDSFILSQARLLLYALCFEIYGSCQQPYYNQIEDDRLEIPEQYKGKAIAFMNRIAFTYCPSITNNKLAMYLLEIAKMETNHDIKRILKFIDEVDENKYVYLCAHFDQEYLYSLISGFSIQIIPLPEDYQCRQQLINPYIKKISKINTKVVGEELHVYGFKKQVGEYSKSYRKLDSQIVHQQIEMEDERLNNPFFMRYLKLGESYKLVHTQRNNQCLQVYVRQRFKDFLIRSYHYQEMNIEQVQKGIKNDREMEEFINQHPHIIKIDDKLVGQTYIMKKIRNCIYSEAQTHQKINTQKLQYLNNMVVSHDKYEEFMKICKIYKITYQYEFKVDLNNWIRVMNYVKKCSKIFLVFKDYADIINLQAIIEDQISLSTIREIFAEWKNFLPKRAQLKSINQNATIVLCPLFFLKTPDVIGMVKDSSEFLKTILCTRDILEQFLKVEYEFNINFAVNESKPYFPSFHKHLHIETSMMKYPSLEKEERMLKEILTKNVIQYAHKEYHLSVIDQYNISQAIANDRQSVEILISKQKPEQEMVYLTYCQKLYKIRRDKHERFENLIDANINRDIPRHYDHQIKNAIKRAFLNGQTYVGFNIPVHEIQYCSMSQFHSKGKQKNHNTIQIWKNKLNSEGEHMLKMIENMSTYIERNFSKKYRMKFENQEIIKQLKEFRIGSGHLQRFKEGNFVGVEADGYICHLILDKLEL